MRLRHKENGGHNLAERKNQCTEVKPNLQHYKNDDYDHSYLISFISRSLEAAQ